MTEFTPKCVITAPLGASGDYQLTPRRSITKIKVLPDSR